MCYFKKVMAMALALAMILSASLVAFAAGSPATAPTVDYVDNNTESHIGKQVDSTFEGSNVTVNTVESTEGEKNVNFKTATNAEGKKVAITTVGNGKTGIFNSDAGRIIRLVRINSKAKKVTVKAKAFTGSKVSKVRIDSKKVQINKNAFYKTKTKNPTIYIVGSKKKASAFTFKKGAFAGLSSKAKIIVNTSTMTKSEFAKFKKAAKAAGFKGTIVRQKVNTSKL